MKNKLQILIPMGGLGQRFRDEGYETPKPLIEVNGMMMFLRALGSFDPISVDKEYIFVVRQDAEEMYGLATGIRKKIPNAKISILKNNTHGAAQTVLHAKDLIDDDQPLIIMDCDFSFESREYFWYVEELLGNNKYDGVLLSFESDNPRYSYARIDSQGLVTATAEKEVISNHALAGAYCFASGELFKHYAEQLIHAGLSDSRKEFYISYVYSEMLKDNKKIKLATVDRFDSYGTPTELKEYLEQNP